MLSTPRSLGFVLAVILGAMLVPGCRSATQTGPHPGSVQPHQPGHVERDAVGGLDGVLREAGSKLELRP